MLTEPSLLLIIFTRSLNLFTKQPPHLTSSQCYFYLSTFSLIALPAYLNFNLPGSVFFLFFNNDSTEPPAREKLAAIR